jgi:hypothetical protein
MIRLLPLLILVISACSPLPSASQAPSAPPDPPRATSATAAGPDPPVAPTPALRSDFAPRYFRTRLQGIRIEGVAFHWRTHRLRVMDQPGGPGSRWDDAAAAARGADGIAAINGGFFSPQGTPLGLVITGDGRHGTLNRASSLGSGCFVDLGPRAALIRRHAFTSARQLLQSGPFLLENGGPVRGLGTRRASARSFIATDTRGGWIIARTGPCSLAELAKALHQQSPGGVRLDTALNLDGGRSSDLWVSARVAGGPASTRPIWNKAVRNFLVLRPVDP